jgi:hypothetical protein
MASRRCPRCSLVNPATAERCDCGFSFVDGSLGQNLEARIAHQRGAEYAGPPRMSGMAVTGFVLSFFCSIVGLGLSIVAHGQIKSSKGQLTGGGLALAGIIIASVNMLFNMIWTLLVVMHH